MLTRNEASPLARLSSTKYAPWAPLFAALESIGSSQSIARSTSRRPRKRIPWAATTPLAHTTWSRAATIRQGRDRGSESAALSWNPGGGHGTDQTQRGTGRRSHEGTDSQGFIDSGERSGVCVCVCRPPPPSSLRYWGTPSRTTSRPADAEFVQRLGPWRHSRSAFYKLSP
jgi:hypothetical protein